MKNFHIETIQIGEREPYLKVYFEDVVDKNLISTWLGLQGFLKNANVNEDDNGKVSAIVYLYPDTDVRDVKDKLSAIIDQI